MITNFKKNNMGTISFDGKFKGMRKLQDFITYPLHAGQDAHRVQVQSDTRIGFIDLATGAVVMTPSIPSGAYNIHLMIARSLDNLTGEELLLLKSHILDSASASAGTNGVVTTDNSGALGVFGANSAA